MIDQWWAANDLPQTVRAILDQAPDWCNAELLDAFAERCTYLGDGRPSPSQSDMLALLGLASGLGVLSVESKVDEGFGKTVDEWLCATSGGKARRLSQLCALFGIDKAEVGHLRYQLIHRTASAIIEAKRYRTGKAAMIVQSWSQQRDGFDDFAAFMTAIGLEPVGWETFSAPINVDGIALRLGWSVEES